MESKKHKEDYTITVDTSKKITPSIVEKFNRITKGFLCRLSDNVYEVEFLKFKIREIESK